MQRILHIVRKMDHGGVQSMIMNYYRNIDRKKIQFDFLELESGQSFYADEIGLYGGHIFKLEGSGSHLKKFYLYCKFLTVNRPSAIHCHLNWLNAIFLFSSLIFLIPIRISHSHNALLPARGVDLIIKKILRVVINTSSTHRFSCSTESAIWLYGAEVIYSNNYTLIRNAIDPVKFTYEDASRELKRAELGIVNELVIGHIGHFNVQKNHTFILEIFKNLANLNPNVVLVLVGTGDLFLDVSEMAKEYGIERQVRFLGDRVDIPELFAAFDIFLFPSLHEGLPFVLLEAQAAGVPCVISDVITREVAIGDGVFFIGLNEPAKTWASEIVSIDLKRRKGNLSSIYSYGYDIRAAAKELQANYMLAFSSLSN
ncbi:hypothetical protein DCO17_01675 [Polynucleobacter tropicus]|uniref:Glycosyl transferase family 1 domain-containing protein n=1 Tax=Polynucleobacter tropicus TaxID=1743174 RepID=A0A6M9PMM3_9BURK|nr:glycosyltransferase family 1 protein [Polynucleobacter tropicus]QKM64050.1 hypothetical protein DCO17_01675 [Polynucleobacter tropicus]